MKCHGFHGNPSWIVWGSPKEQFGAVENLSWDMGGGACKVR